MVKYAFLGNKEEYFILTNCFTDRDINWLDIFSGYDEILEKIKKDSYSCLLVKKKDNYIANRLLWESVTLKEVMIVDSENPFELEMKKWIMSKKKMWDFISVNSQSQIEEGGYFHCFNNIPFTKEEVKEFADNVYLKLRDYLNKEKTALEIGCASGITMFRLLPYLKAYIGVDMASISLKKNKERIEKENINNVTFFQKEANEIISLPVGKVDIVIINSVVQYFPGINYLKEVISQSFSLMQEEGLLYLGDIMDLEKKEDLIRAAQLYKKEHPEADTRLDYSDELFLSRKYFDYLASVMDDIYKIEITNKLGKIRNEMTDFRYDVILYYKKGCGMKGHYSRKIQTAKRII